MHVCRRLVNFVYAVKRWHIQHYVKDAAAEDRELTYYISCQVSCGRHEDAISFRARFG